MSADLIAQIYDAGLAGEGWTRVLAGISRQFQDASVFMSDEQAARFGRGRPWFHRYDRSIYDDATEELWALDRNTPLRDIHRTPPGIVVDRVSLISDADLDRSPVGRHFLVRGGIHHMLLTVPQRDEQRVGVLWVGRFRYAPAFNSRERRRLRALSTHVGGAMRMYQALDRERSAARTLAQALDRMPRPVLLLDAARRILHANSAALRLLESGQLLRERAGRLCLPTRSGQAQLERVAARLSAAEPELREYLIELGGRQAEANLRLRVSPALGDATCLATPRARMIVLVEDPVSSVNAVDPGRLMAEFHLTEAEARTAAALAGAASRAQAAAALGVSVNTVKTHLLAVYGKLNIHTQAELIRLLAAQPIGTASD